MKTIILRRIAKNKDGVFGILIDGNVPFAVTVEPEDKNNKSNISCIPEGEYKCFFRRKETSNRNYDIWELMNVPNRSNIQIHKGVTEDSSEGCIIVGESFEPYKKKSAGVMQSTKAYNELMARTAEKEFMIIKIEEWRQKK